VIAKASLDAEPALVGGAIGLINPNDLAVLDNEVEAAADTAVGTDGTDLLEIPGPADTDHLFGLQGAGRADSHTVAAEDAGAVLEAVVKGRCDL